MNFRFLWGKKWSMVRYCLIRSILPGGKHIPLQLPPHSWLCWAGYEENHIHRNLSHPHVESAVPVIGRAFWRELSSPVVERAWWRFCDRDSATWQIGRILRWRRVEIWVCENHDQFLDENQHFWVVNISLLVSFWWFYFRADDLRSSVQILLARNAERRWLRLRLRFPIRSWCETWFFRRPDHNNTMVILPCLYTFVPYLLCE